jgi:hypothetical protein
MAYTLKDGESYNQGMRRMKERNITMKLYKMEKGSYFSVFIYTANDHAYKSLSWMMLPHYAL